MRLNEAIVTVPTLAKSASLLAVFFATILLINLFMLVLKNSIPPPESIRVRLELILPTTVLLVKRFIVARNPFIAPAPSTPVFLLKSNWLLFQPSVSY